MKKIVTLGITLALSLATVDIAMAQNNHSHSTQTPDGDTSSIKGQAGPMAGNRMHMMQKMMQMMQQMHGGMTGSGGMDMNGAGGMQGMAMMDRDMMRMMMGPGTMGMPSPKDATAKTQSRLVEFDANGDGNLSLAEFKALHTAMIHESIVDRFQHLDADGDGQITKAEIGAPARRMGMRGKMNSIPNGDIDE